jgi:hypothetical protein
MWLRLQLQLRLLSIYHRLEETLQKKIMVAEEVFLNCYRTILILLFKSKKVISSYLIKLSGAGAGAGAGILICGSVEPEPKEIYSAPQHCS